MDIIWNTTEFWTFIMQANGMPITVGVGNVISEEGFSLLISPAVAGPVWKALVSLGAVPMGSRAWEMLRIFQGVHLSTFFCSLVCWFAIVSCT